ncbi:hypothetical protein PHLCEN_2v7787 [Hermanssonia centrifuga]|uniref:Uncharacterized protein n=1 Tax=Hermanssonia centrifuga TaxID=98765 RepID=A0A2R6NVI8_9APHY|nr:hypothetical protein PHLCEN_2v7787 [Hermanssonia centrifuga]
MAISVEVDIRDQSGSEPHVAFTGGISHFSHSNNISEIASLDESTPSSDWFTPSPEEEEEEEIIYAE